MTIRSLWTLVCRWGRGGGGWLGGLLGLALLAAGCGRVGAPAGSPAEAAKPGGVPLTNMVRIAAGQFVQLKRPVTLTRDYWIGRFEVTQGEYAALMKKNPSHFAGDPQRPVEKVSHGEAVAYCAALTAQERAAGRLPAGYEYRLPTEAEWEYACRAGSTNLFSFGSDVAQAEAHAWTEENSEGTTHPVGGKAANAWGLHDMHGNVWEWCHDWFSELPPGAVSDPTGPATGTFKVFRGGGWNHAAKFAGAANRFMMPPANGIFFVGFRVVLGPSR